MKNVSVKIGEKIDLYLGKGPYYRSTVDDISLDNALLVPIPTYKGIPVILRNGQELRVFFYRDNGRFFVTARVVGFDLTSPVRIVKLEVLSDPERQQRRESFRVTTMLQAILRPYHLGPFPLNPDPSESEEMEEVSSFNISATGIAVRTTEEYRVGELMYMRIFLAWPSRNSPPLDILGEVRQVLRLEPGKDIFQLGVMFVDISPDLSTHIAKYCLMEDQRRMKQKKLIEEE